MRHVGLTNDPERRRQEHGNPLNFKIERMFKFEANARQWEKDMLAKEHRGDTGSKGWKYGYTYSIA